MPGPQVEEQAQEIWDRLQRQCDPGMPVHEANLLLAYAVASAREGKLDDAGNYALVAIAITLLDTVV
jgi:hypothetical protein